MRKKVLLSLLTVIMVLANVSTVFALPIHSYHAQNVASSPIQKNVAFKTKALSQNVVYSYDLDGDGIKEKIKYSILKKDDLTEKMEIILYIDAKEKYRKKMDYALNAQYTIADIEAKDEYLDLFLMVTSDSYCLEYVAFQQYQSNRIKTLCSNLSNKSLRYIRGYDIEGVDGQGRFKADIDTPFNMEAIGSYICNIPFVMDKGKVNRMEVSSYSLQNTSDFKYLLQQGVKVYEKASSSSKLLRTIKKGEAITISKIKPNVGSYDCIKRPPISGYAYIEDKSGRKGWIYLDKKYNWKNPLFKETPAWG